MEYKKEPVNGYEEYEVDTNGVVYKKNGGILRHSINPNGYCIVNFSINGKPKGFSVHKLVAKQFIPNNDTNKTQINHIDGNKTNNAVTNLEWVTGSENMMHSVNVLGNCIGAKNGNAKAVKGVSKKDSNVLMFDSMSDAARYFSNLCDIDFQYVKNSLWRALHGIRKSYKGYCWCYL